MFNQKVNMSSKDNNDLEAKELILLSAREEFAEMGFNGARMSEIAKKANVGTLILGHYSTRYNDLEVFRTEAQTIFEKVELAEDGKTFEF